MNIKDWVVDRGGNPVSGATVNYRAASDTVPNANPILGTTTTDANGMFQFTGIASGSYDWDATPSGSTEKMLSKGRVSPPFSFDLGLSGLAHSALGNPDFNIWQRGTSFSIGPSATAWTADRWFVQAGGSAVLTVARDTSVPAVGSNAINTPYSLKMTIPTTADASIAAGDLYYIEQPIEGFDYRPLTNGFAMSFWVKAHRTGTYCVAFTNRGANRSYVVEYTITAADTWEYKTVVVTTPPTAGTWDYTNQQGLRVYFTLAAGSTYQTTAGAWQTGDFQATSNQVNGVGATTDTFSLALTNLIPGATAQPLVPRPVEVELARCQRYCQRLGAASGGGFNQGIGSGFCDATTHAYVTVGLRVAMGGTPTATFSAANTFFIFSGAGATTALTAIALNASHPEIVTLACTVAAGLTIGQGCLLIDAAGASSILLEWNPA